MHFIKNIFTNKYVRYALFAIFIGGSVYLFFGREKINSINVKKISVSNNIVEKTVSASGNVKSDKDANLSFSSSGKILAIYVKEGDKVSKGDLLAVQDTSSLGETIQAAKSARDASQKDLDLYIQKYDSHRGLLGGSDEYEIGLKKQQELLNQADSTYESEKALLQNSKIYSPIDGVVYDVIKKQGETAVPSEAVVRVADLQNLTFEVQLDQEDFGAVKIGQPAEIELDAYPNQKIKGSVVELPSYADVNNASRFIVKITFDKSNNLPPLLGMTGDVHIIVATSGKAVPSLMYDQIFSDDNNNYYVWVVDDKNLISKNYINVGLEGDIYYEIKSDVNKTIVVGLNEDVVVKDGYKAKIVK